MPQVEPTEVTAEETQKQNETQESLQNNVLDRIKGGHVFKNLAEDLPSRETDESAEKAETEKPEPRGNAKPIRDEVEEQPEEEQEQEENQESEQEEEVIAKSKVQPRFDQMTARIRRLEQELADKKESNAPVDDVQRQLDSLSEEALEDSLIQVRVAKEESRSDPAKLTELVKLERRIEKTIATAPQKFVQSQVKEANKAIENLVHSGDITDSNFSKIQEVAKAIYDGKPRLQKMVDGQAMAFELAAEHVKTLGKATTVTASNQNLKGQNNNLKKKLALDTKAVKTGGDKVNLDRLRTNAMTGTMKDKEKFAMNDSRFKIDAMIPDFLKG